jgi:hypothetical protein
VFVFDFTASQSLQYWDTTSISGYFSNTDIAAALWIESVPVPDTPLFMKISPRPPSSLTSACAVF